MAQTVKNPPAMQETQVRSLGQEDPWKREWRQRSLEGYSPWGHKESDMTEGLTFSPFFSPGSHPGRVKSDHEWEGRHLITFKVLPVILMCRSG